MCCRIASQNSWQLLFQKLHVSFMLGSKSFSIKYSRYFVTCTPIIACKACVRRIVASSKCLMLLMLVCLTRESTNNCSMIADSPVLNVGSENGLPTTCFMQAFKRLCFRG